MSKKEIKINKDNSGYLKKGDKGFTIFKSLYFLTVTGIVAGFVSLDNLSTDNIGERNVKEAKIGDFVNGKYFYQKDDLYDIYYVTTKDINDNYSTHIVKEFNAEDYFSYDKKTNTVTTYGEHYIGKDYRKIFGNFDYDKLNAKLYVDAIDDKIVSVVKSSLYSESDTLLGTLFPNYSFNIDLDRSSSACVFRYNSIVDAKSMYDCLEYLEIDNQTYTTSDLEQIKEKIDNFKSKRKTK